MLKKICTFVLLSAIAATANANLIVNGSFEDNAVNPGTWRWFYSADVNGWTGSNIEIWDDFLGVKAVDGTQFAELNAHANSGQQFTIAQSFNTTVNSLYDLSFFYRARRSNDEAFQVSLSNGQSNFFEQIMTDHIVGEWSFFNATFRAASSTTTLLFSSVQPHSGTVGNFLDNIVVTGAPTSLSAQPVSEPAAFTLLAIFGGLFLMRLKKRQVVKK